MAVAGAQYEPGWIVAVAVKHRQPGLAHVCAFDAQTKTVGGLYSGRHTEPVTCSGVRRAGTCCGGWKTSERQAIGTRPSRKIRADFRCVIHSCEISWACDILSNRVSEMRPTPKRCRPITRRRRGSPYAHGPACAPQRPLPGRRRAAPRPRLKAQKRLPAP